MSSSGSASSPPTSVDVVDIGTIGEDTERVGDLVTGRMDGDKYCHEIGS